MVSNSAAETPDKPENWPRFFERRLNARDLDAAMKLYEPEARFVTKSDEILVGHDAIRRVLAEMIYTKTQMHSRVIRAVTVGDIAQLYADFEGTKLDAT